MATPGDGYGYNQCRKCQDMRHGLGTCYCTGACQENVTWKNVPYPYRYEPYVQPVWDQKVIANILIKDEDLSEKVESLLIQLKILEALDNLRKDIRELAAAKS